MLAVPLTVFKVNSFTSHLKLFLLIIRIISFLKNCNSSNRKQCHNNSPCSTMYAVLQRCCQRISREALWLYVNVLSVVMLILGRNWHWSASLRNTTQMFLRGEGQIRTRKFQDDITEGVEGCCCQRSPALSQLTAPHPYVAHDTWTDYETMGPWAQTCKIHFSSRGAEPD